MRGQRIAQVLDVLAHAVLTGVRDWSGARIGLADAARAAPPLRVDRTRGVHHLLLGVYLGELERVARISAKPRLGVERRQSTQTQPDVAGETGFAVLAVADDVETAFRLVPHDAGHAIADLAREHGVVQWLAQVARPQQLHEQRRAWQAAAVGRQNALGAALHRAAT